MAITVDTPPADTDLTTLAAVKRELGLVDLSSLTLTIDHETRQITRASGNWVSDKVKIGKRIKFGGLANGGNNDIFKVQSISDSGKTLVVYDQENALVSETSVADCTASEDEHDALISSLISQASSTVTSYVDRDLAKQTITETTKGFGRDTLILTVTPVTVVSQILQDNSPVTSWSIEDPEAGTIYRENGWDWTIPFGTGDIERFPLVGQEVPDYVATYVGGYWLPSFGGSPAATDILLPPTIERATILIAKSRFITRERDTTLTSVKTDEISVQFRDSGMDQIQTLSMPQEAASLLIPFRRCA